MLIPEAAICRANSLPIPDEAPVTSAQGLNLSLSSAALIFLLRSACLGPCCVIRSHRSVDYLIANAHFTRFRLPLWACGFSPPGASQASNPTLEPLGLRRHKTGV